VIEQRSAQEVTAQAVPCRNPAFDVTPAALVTALVTEQGVKTRA
jgi:methylthioribose-1-phosphate isomerase